MTTLDPDALIAGEIEALPDADLLSDIKQLIISVEAERPRSQQTALGPSQVGHECERRLAYSINASVNAGKLTRESKGANSFSDPMAAIIGTAVHGWLEEAVIADNRRLGRYRWIPEHKVEVREGLSGTCDLYDLDTATVLDWKGLSLDTPIPTPVGWSTIGRLKVGDSVFAADGTICTVVAKSPVFSRDCYRITFEDGVSIISDNVHEWVFGVAGRKGPETLTTEAAAGLIRDGRGQARLRISNTEPLQLPDADLPVMPYTLGAWLGDGDSTSGRICKPDDDLFANIELEGYQVRPPREAKPLRRRVAGLTSRLRAAGVLGHKHIPQEYLRASFRQRLALLQGLMDTDGTYNKLRNQCMFSTSNKELADQFAELVSSLGWKPRIWKLNKHGFGLDVVSYEVTFISYDHNPFKIPRKAELVRKDGTTRARRRYVRAIERTLTVPTQCITVDSKDQTFLCGREMIPTHNCPGSTRYEHYAKHGPSNTYRGQAHLYGRGYKRLGFPVKYVGNIYISRAGSLRKIHLWREPYNDALVDEILDRYDRVGHQMEMLRVDEFPDNFKQIPVTPDSDCIWCPWFSVNPEGPFSCGKT